ncbi:hypothetical protein AC579_2950 [Pseudocercospora musae]|uniref:Uncharacterized protein n=1 Tax=Pseudocercospora musae TaxID=113226 RepID=A0A139IFB2_9PEZI|nr:hypothetical protein AC579_2950 [Pseudocercospora musae]
MTGIDSAKAAIAMYTYHKGISETIYSQLIGRLAPSKDLQRIYQNPSPSDYIQPPNIFKACPNAQNTVPAAKIPKDEATQYRMNSRRYMAIEKHEHFASAKDIDGYLHHAKDSSQRQRLELGDGVVRVGGCDGVVESAILLTMDLLVNDTHKESYHLRQSYRQYLRRILIDLRPRLRTQFSNKSWPYRLHTLHLGGSQACASRGKAAAKEAAADFWS